MNKNFLRLLMLSSYIKNRNYYKLSSKQNFSNLYGIDYYGYLNEYSCYFEIYNYYKQFCNSDLWIIQIRLCKDIKNVKNSAELNRNFDYRISVIFDILWDRELNKKIVWLPSHRRIKCSKLRKRHLAYSYSRLYAGSSQIKDSVLWFVRNEYETKIFDEAASPHFKKACSFIIETIDDVILDREDGHIS